MCQRTPVLWEIYKKILKIKKIKESVESFQDIIVLGNFAYYRPSPEDYLNLLVYQGLLEVL